MTNGHGTPTPTVTDEEEEHIHLPGPSWWPFALALFLTVAMSGLTILPHYGAAASAIRWIVALVIFAIGAIGMAWSIISWGLEVSEA